MTTVTLSVNGAKRDFPIDHAQKILDYQGQTGLVIWSLTDDKYEIINGLIKRRNKKTDKSAKE